MGKVLTLFTKNPGLVLRQLSSPADNKAYFEAQNEDPEHIAEFSNTVYKTMEDLRKARLDAKKTKRLWLGIWLGDTLIGKIDAKPSPDDTQAEVGYWLRPSATGKGYATLALKTFTSHVKPKFKRVFAEVHIDNKASIKVMERCGYVRIKEVNRYWGRAIVFEAKM